MRKEIHLLILMLVDLEGVQSVSASACIRHAPSVSVIRITAGTRFAAVAANVSPVWSVAVVTAVNVALYSKEN